MADPTPPPPPMLALHLQPPTRSAPRQDPAKALALPLLCLQPNRKPPRRLREERRARPRPRLARAPPRRSRQDRTPQPPRRPPDAAPPRGGGASGRATPARARVATDQHAALPCSISCLRAPTGHDAPAYDPRRQIEEEAPRGPYSRRARADPTATGTARALPDDGGGEGTERGDREGGARVAHPGRPRGSDTGPSKNFLDSRRGGDTGERVLFSLG
nr:uncharacterized protein DKFZp434B061-like [Aegilops tauschii subsp. strangulata]